MMEREVYMLYEMNKEAHIVIETPVGITYSITVHETTIWSKIVQCGNREDSWHKRRVSVSYI